MRNLLPVLALCAICIAAFTVTSSISADDGDSIQFVDADGFTYSTDGVVEDGYAKATVISYVSDNPPKDLVIKETVEWKARGVNCIITEVESYCVLNYDIETISIPKTVTNFDSDACHQCKKLERFIVDPENPIYGTNDGVLEIKNKSILVKCPQNYYDEEFDATEYTVLYNSAFSECENIKSITLSQYTMMINADTFYNCTNLEHINYDPVTKKNILPDRITVIGNNAFSGCRSLENIELPDELRGIGNLAFGGCAKLTSISIPGEVIDIEESAFSYCDSLERFDVSDRNEMFDSIDGVLYKKSDTKAMYTLISYPASRQNDTFEFREDVALIERHAFTNTKYLKTVILPDVIVDVPEYSFYDAHSIENVILGDNTVSIKPGAFANCENLKNVEVPDCLTNYGSNAFSYCYALEGIKMPSKLTAIGDNTFFKSGLRGAITLPGSLKTIGCCAFMDTHLDNIRIEGNPTIDNEAFSIKGTITVTHYASLTIPETAYGSDTTVIENTIGKWFPVSNIIGIIVCVLILIAIILLFRRI